MKNQPEDSLPYAVDKKRNSSVGLAELRRFDDTKLWKVLKTVCNLTSDTSEELGTVLEEFAGELHTYCWEESDIAERIRTLRYTRSELSAFQETLPHLSKENASIHAVLKRAIYFIDCEIDIIKMELEHPDRFISFPSNNAPLARWNGSIAELLEYVIPPQIAGRLSKPAGEPMAYSDVVKLLETIFGISISAPYDRKTKLLSRMKNATPFIDKMRQTFREEAEKMHQ